MGTSSDEPILLHGDLEFRIIAARNSGTSSEVDLSGQVTVSVANTIVTSARTSSNTSDSQRGKHFNILLAHPVVDLEFEIKVGEKVSGGKGIEGTVKIPSRIINTSEILGGWCPLEHVKGDPYKDWALKIEIKFTSCDQNPLYRQGIASDPEQAGVRNTHFPPRKGNALKLFQDAHVPKGKLPEIVLEDGSVFEHHKCWEEIHHAISEAKHMIYIMGWSVFCDLKLVREPSRPFPRARDSTLGELLKAKSKEGVQVLILIWDDKTSYDILGIKGKGVMQTHGQETREFFKGSSVICYLVPREASESPKFSEQFVNGYIFSNHQKCVIVDTEVAGYGRTITAFLGGLDLCDGRYDTPEHRLFGDADTIFKNDFRNPTFPSKTKAPREPWHDLHCRIDGQAVHDVFLNFTQHWRKAATGEKNSGYALCAMERISQKLRHPCPTDSADGTTGVFGEDDWHVQIFRSTDAVAVEGFPVDPGFAYAQNLICSKCLVIDVSIQIAYIQAIRSAQHFIYIENQYFIGSSYAWASRTDAGANNLIPMELALKITSKIEANERFAVYVVIPMWPEGNPRSKIVKQMLFFQSQTMKMMYDIIATKLKEKGLQDAHPQDYLNFYCLGNREECIPGENLASNVDKVSKSQEFQRFMIYVHSKAMIVDDEYVMLGSANINQRSMDGSRDTEIAMGAYQPHYTWGRKGEHPRGKVFGYRTSLWAEHLGTVDSLFDVPESLECVEKVKEIAEENWKNYTADEFTSLQGHLLKYPIHVKKDGEVSHRPGYERFPDVGGLVRGKDSPPPFLPPFLSTAWDGAFCRCM